MVKHKAQKSISKLALNCLWSKFAQSIKCGSDEYY